jgi:hypothetical protein
VTANPVYGSRGKNKRRREAVAPQMDAYSRLANVLWPLVTVTARPETKTSVVSTDSRGHRITRMGERAVRSDDAPPDAGFVLGGSFAFGVGASSDAGTLASALSRRTGTPYVNLGIRTGNSTQELIAALPFAERSTVFIVCSGVNNMTRSGQRGFDPLFGPMVADPYFPKLSALPVAEVSKRLKNPLRLVETQALSDELNRRLQRLEAESAQGAGERSRPSKRKEQKSNWQVDPAAAVRLQLRDLRALGRIVPDDALVVFALQPFAPRVSKELSAEEEELFALLDDIQGVKWHRLRDALSSEWDEFASGMEAGSRALGVLFVDLSMADYSGWCFVDRVHATDAGNEAAAALLAKVVPVSGSGIVDAEPVATVPSTFDVDDAGEADEGEDPNVYPLW